MKTSWPDRPAAGLAREFQQVHVGVCTTDDGGSTGELVRRLPMIGIGDLRERVRNAYNQARQQQPTLTMAAFVESGAVDQVRATSR